MRRILRLHLPAMSSKRTPSYARAVMAMMHAAHSRVPVWRETKGAQAVGSEHAQRDPKRNSGSGHARFDLPAPTLDALVAMIVSLNASAAKTSVPGDPAAGKQFFFGKGQCCVMPHGERRRLRPRPRSFQRRSSR